MAVAALPVYERRVHALRERLVFNFQSLRDTLVNGLEIPVQPEAAVYCTATAEAMCEALFGIVVKQLQDEAITSNTPMETKVTVLHLQLALRSHSDLEAMLSNVDSAAVVLECFMDEASSRALYERHLIATREAKHLRGNALDDELEEDRPDEEELIRQHERTRSEWQKRDDDPFSEADLAMVLKGVHPACTLSYNATTMLSALLRELLNEVCDRIALDDVHTRAPPRELLLEDVEVPVGAVFHVGELGERFRQSADECLARFRLQFRNAASLAIRFRVYPPTSMGMITHSVLWDNIARETPLTAVLTLACAKCRVDAAAYVALFRGRQVDPQQTANALAMPAEAVVFLVPKQWWTHTRRNEARRGLLSSVRPHDAQLRALVAGTESKVKRACHHASQTSSASQLELSLQPPIDLSSLHVADRVPATPNPNPVATVAAAALLRGDMRRSCVDPVRATTPSHQQQPSQPRLSSLAVCHSASTSLLDPVGPPARNPDAASASAADPMAPHLCATADKRRAMDRALAMAAVDDTEAEASADGPHRGRRAGKTQTGRRGWASDADAQQAQEQEQDDLGPGGGQDSLARLLLHQRQRQRQRRSAAPRGAGELRNETSAASGSSPQSDTAAATSPSAHALTHALATQSALLLDTLDQAWLGFAAVSGGVRGLPETFGAWPEQLDGAVLERELQRVESGLATRVQQMDALVRQTTGAKNLVAQLLLGARQLYALKS